jgi:hypothetical protein
MLSSTYKKITVFTVLLLADNTRHGADREKIDDSINFCKFVLASSVPLLIFLTHGCR